MATRLIRRTPRQTHAAKTVFAGYTNPDGTRAGDAPKNWPFGMQRLHAVPKVKRKEKED